MRESLFVVGLVVFGMALRSCRNAVPRKLGAFVYLAASFYALYFATGRVWGGILGVLAWFFLPWVELLTRIRRMRLPIENRLRLRTPPDPSFFPDAEEAAVSMEEAGFEHVNDCGWEWSGMKQFFRLFWHPEERAVAAVCLCEQSDVAFSFITVTSRDDKGRSWRTTNFPFSPTLSYPPRFQWNRVKCENRCFPRIMRDHREFLLRAKVDREKLVVPDPERIEEEIEREMRDHIEHNLDHGIIRLTGDGRFRYSRRGLLFLWKQYLKDMIRLC
jgi:hypothetical protein